MYTLFEKSFIHGDAMIETVIPLNANHKMHQHDFYEICYILSGSLTHIVNNKSYNLNEGDCFIIVPEHAHAFTNSLNCSLRNILVSQKLINHLKMFLPNPIVSLKEISGKTFHLSTKNISSHEQLFTEYSLESNSDIKNLIGINLIIQFITFFIKSGETKKQEEYPLVVQQIVEYLNRDFYLTDCSQKLEMFSYSRAYLCTIFKKHTKKSIVEYLTDIRLEHAVFFLKNTNLSLNQIADKIGISSLAYFNNIFKKKYNITPIKFRKTNRVVMQ